MTPTGLVSSGTPKVAPSERRPELAPRILGIWHAQTRLVDLKDRAPFRGTLREAALIVSSILVAFAIDAWWDGRQTRALESEQALAAREEVSINLLQIGRSMTTLKERIDRADQFLRSAPSELRDLPADTIRVTLNRLYVPSTVVLELGAVNSLATAPLSRSGNDSDTRRLVSKWLTQAGYMEIRRSQAADLSQRIEDLLADYAAAAANMGWRRVSLMIAFQGCPSVLADLRTDDEFVPLVIRMASAREAYLTGLARLQVTGDSLLAAFDGR